MLDWKKKHPRNQSNLSELALDMKIYEGIKQMVDAKNEWQRPKNGLIRTFEHHSKLNEAKLYSFIYDTWDMREYDWWRKTLAKKWFQRISQLLSNPYWCCFFYISF